MADGILLAGEAMGLLTALEEGPLEKAETFRSAVAGAEFNVAVGLCRLGHRAAYFTKLGDDPFGRRIRKALQAEGLSVRDVHMSAEHPTGWMFKSKTAAGDPDIFYCRRGSAASFIGPEDVAGLDFSGLWALHLTGIFPALSEHTRDAALFLLTEAKRRGMTVFFDPNLRPPLWKSPADMRDTLLAFAREVDVVLPGLAEGRFLTGETAPEAIAEAFLKMGARAAVVKTGPGGAYAATRSESFFCPAYRVDRIVDTVGAGDGFAAGVISALGEELPLREAVRRGNAIGAIQLGFPGDNEGLPDRETLALFERDHGIRQKEESHGSLV